MLKATPYYNVLGKSIETVCKFTRLGKLAYVIIYQSVAEEASYFSKRETVSCYDGQPDGVDLKSC